MKIIETDLKPTKAHKTMKTYEEAERREKRRFSTADLEDSHHEKPNTRHDGSHGKPQKKKFKVTDKRPVWQLRMGESHWLPRRASYEMDIGRWEDEWDDTTEESYIRILLKRLGIPEEDLHEISRSGSIVTMTVDFRRAQFQQGNLYRDAGDMGEQVQLSEPHVQLGEVDPWRGPYWASDFERELQRAHQLSYKPIMNAPPSYLDLPWNKISNSATIEEMLVYFPNHVARWPGLAVALRWTNWDRVFYRAARIINLARGSHQTPNRDDLHTEVLPLQMKVERAIKELFPNYDLWDFDHVSIEPRVGEFLHTRPTGQNQRSDTICTLEEAAGYITGINEFQEYSPFSQMMKQYHPSTESTIRPTMPVSDAGLGNIHDYYTYKMEKGDSFTGWPIRKPEPPFDMCWSVPCDDLDCNKTHPQSHEYQQWVKDTNNSKDSESRNSFSGSTGQYDNASESFEEADNHYNSTIGECHEKAGCIDRACENGHRGPWTGTGVHVNFDTWCRAGVGCTDQTCSKAHKSWAHLENGKGPVGNINGSNGDVHRAKWQTPCNANPCSQANCWFGHRGPRTKANVQPNFRQEPKCSFDRNCTSPKCNKAHSSPARSDDSATKRVLSDQSDGFSKRTRQGSGEERTANRGGRGDHRGGRGDHRGGRGGHRGRGGRGGHGGRGRQDQNRGDQSRP